MKYILDTNAASALMKGDVRFVNRLEQVPRFEVAIPEPVPNEANEPASRSVPQLASE